MEIKSIKIIKRPTELNLTKMEKAVREPIVENSADNLIFMFTIHSNVIISKLFKVSGCFIGNTTSLKVDL